MRAQTVRNLLRLPPRSWLTLCEITLTWIWVELGLRLGRFRKLREQLPVPSPFPAAPRPAQPELPHDELCRLAAKVFRHLPVTPTCLTRALVVMAMLERRGTTAALKIGVVKSDEGALHAHAWLERDGTVLLDDPAVETRFAPLQSCA